MPLRTLLLTPLALATVGFVPAAAPVAPPPRPVTDWPMFGGTPSRNMVNPHDALPPLPRNAPDAADLANAWEPWLRWKADLGTHTYAGPVVAGGRVYVGTNNQRPRNKRDTRRTDDGEDEPLDKGVLMCFDAPTGAFLWQAATDTIPPFGLSDWPRVGACSVPTVVGDRVYHVNNLCRVVCLDAKGFADGNQGMQAEKYRDPTDADVLWEYDMLRELGVAPHNNVSNGSPLVIGDLLYTVTGNGVDEGHFNVRAPNAPSLVCLNRHTGRLVWSDNSPGRDILHGQWSSPAYAAGPVPQVVFGGGDGWLRGFDPPTGRLLWKFDGNPKDGVYELGGAGTKSEFVGCPVVWEGRVYVGVGQDPEHTDGIGRFWCVDLAKAVAGGAADPARDVSPELVVRADKDANGRPRVVTRPNPASAAAWTYGGEEKRRWSVTDFRFGRTMSTACVVDGVLYVPELPGHLHCLDARTGKHFWRYDTKTPVWGSCYAVDGKVLLGNDNGDLYVFRHDPRPAVLDELADTENVPTVQAARRIRWKVRAEIEQRFLHAKIEFDAPIRTTPAVAGGVLYVVAEKTLFAFGPR